MKPPAKKRPNRAGFYLCLCAALLIPAAVRGLRTSVDAHTTFEANPTRTVAPVHAELSRGERPASPERGEPELPRAYVDTNYVPPSGKIIHVSVDGKLQEALDQAKPGDTIELSAGAVYSGNFTLPKKTASDNWIIIRSDTPDSKLPPFGERITPSYANILAKIISPNSEPAIASEPGAHHFRLMGLEISVPETLTQNYNLIMLGIGTREKSIEQFPHHIIIDRCYIHGNDRGNIRRGVAINGASLAVIDSYISNFHEVGADSQAVAGWGGPGPFKIVNNYLEGACENFIYGGADPGIPGLVPSDFEIRRNHLYKPLKWRVGDPSFIGIRFSVKNLLEFKNAQRVLIEGNVLENNWQGGQAGFAVLFTPQNQDGKCPQCVVADVTFRYNRVVHAGSGINISGMLRAGGLSTPSRRIAIVHNVFEDIDQSKWGGRGFWFQIAGPEMGPPQDIIIKNNVAIQSGWIIAAGNIRTVRIPGLVFLDNITAQNNGGIVGTSTAPGLSTLTSYFPDAIFKKNVIVGGSSGYYPRENFFPSKWDDVKFEDFRAGNFRLAEASRYRRAGTDGMDIGVDMQKLEEATAGVVNPRATPPR